MEGTNTLSAWSLVANQVKSLSCAPGALGAHGSQNPGAPSGPVAGLHIRTCKPVKVLGDNYKAALKLSPDQN